jgi:hypothetical protein
LLLLLRLLILVLLRTRRGLTASALVWRVGERGAVAMDQTLNERSRAVYRTRFRKSPWRLALASRTGRLTDLPLLGNAAKP